MHTAPAVYFALLLKSDKPGDVVATAKASVREEELSKLEEVPMPRRRADSSDSFLGSVNESSVDDEDLTRADARRKKAKRRRALSENSMLGSPCTLR